MYLTDFWLHSCDLDASASSCFPIPCRVSILEKQFHMIIITGPTVWSVRWAHCLKCHRAHFCWWLLSGSSSHLCMKSWNGWDSNSCAAPPMSPKKSSAGDDVDSVADCLLCYGRWGFALSAATIWPQIINLPSLHLAQAGMAIGGARQLLPRHHWHWKIGILRLRRRRSWVPGDSSALEALMPFQILRASSGDSLNHSCHIAVWASIERNCD